MLQATESKLSVRSLVLQLTSQEERLPYLTLLLSQPGPRTMQRTIF